MMLYNLNLTILSNGKILTQWIKLNNDSNFCFEMHFGFYGLIQINKKVILIYLIIMGRRTYLLGREQSIAVDCF